MSYDYDVVVIGSGAGGTVATRLLAKAGKSVAVVESGKLGGECPWVACIPTKALLESAHLFHKARNSEKLGLRGSGIGFNYPSVRAWKNQAIKNTGVEETESSLHQAGINVIHGHAHFLNSQTITVGRARFKARYFVVATGSEPTLPSFPGFTTKDFLTYKTALELSRPPKSLAIVGGGPVAVEFASIFGSFGSKVYLIERGSHLLGSEDPLVGKTLADNLKDGYNLEVITGATLTQVQKRGLKKQLSIKVSGNVHSLAVDEIMFATGKLPGVDIGLENAGVSYDKTGIKVSRTMKTTQNGIFAIGDVTSSPYKFTHVSLLQARLASHNILHPKKQLALDYKAIPRAIFTSPEVAAVGPSAKQLLEQKIPTISSTCDINVVSKGSVGMRTTGFVKLTAHKKTNQLLSASIVAPGASEMIHELTLAINHGLRASDVADTVHAFPTWSESIRVAASKLASSE